MPEVSVIVPVYKVEKYLPRCIDSILGQTFRDFELILVDDGSPDNCGAICDAYASKDERIRVIHKKNAGVSAARNTGIDAATGKYIMFVDSDDYITETMLEEMLLYDDSDIVLSGLRYTNVEGDTIKEHIGREMKKISLNEFLNNDYTNFDIRVIVAGPCNKLFRKEIIELNSVYFHEDICICEDGLFVVEFLERCETVSCIPKCYYNYVQYGAGTLITKYNTNAIEACERLYQAKIKLLRHSGIINEEIYEKIENGSYRSFGSFLFQIYTRSGLSRKEKYYKTKEALKNDSFIELIKKHKGKNVRTLLLKISVLTKNVVLLHMISCMYFNRK